MRLIGITSLLVGLWVVHTCSAALPNGAQNLEEDQQSGKPANGNRLFNRAIRGSQNNAPAARLNAPVKSQTAQTKPPSSPPAPVESDFGQESGEERQEQESPEVEAIPVEEPASSTTTSTEVPTRRKLGGAVRPIQSKKDFMERLERRRKLQQQNGYTVVPPTSTSTTEKPVTKANQPNTRKTHAPKTPTPPINQGSQKKTSANRRYNSKATTPVQTTPLPASSNEAIAEESNLATQSSKIRSFPKTRRTSMS